MDSGSSTSTSMPPINAEATSSTDHNPSCSICKCTDGKVAEISDVDELKSIKDQILEHSSIIKKVTHACLKCLYKLYTFIEHSRIEEYKKSRNKQLFVVGDLIVETGGIRPSISLSSESSSSSNSSIIPDEQIFEREFVGGKNIQMNSEYNNDSDGVNEPEEEQHTVENTENVVEGVSIEDHTNSRMNSDHLDDLDIMFETSESALVTESGGNPDQYKPQPQRCLYCSKTFVRPKMYNRHLRSHESKLRSRSRSASRSRATSTNVVYKCDDCPTTFSSSQLLKKHSKIHLKQHSCNYCHLYFFTASERDIHQAECFGKEMAKTSITRHSTRSVTRSLAARSQYAQSEILQDTKNKSENQSISRRIPITKQPAQSMGYDDEDDDDDDDDDDELSVSCSDHFSFVQSWVNKTCKMLTSEFADESPVVVCQKEYDIIMLERLIEQSENSQYTCTFIGCGYTTARLRDMCFHEVKTHRSKTYYNCRKCKGRFTSKLFLDYHLYLQNYGEYHCNKCAMTFIYEYKLQHHLIQHQQHDSFPCLYCDSSYMSETELRIHAIETGHNTKKRKKTISIDKLMTIANAIPPEPKPPKREYKFTEKILELPKTESKRPMHIIWPKYTKIFLGDLDFEYEPGRNCVKTN